MGADGKVIIERLCISLLCISVSGYGTCAEMQSGVFYCPSRLSFQFFNDLACFLIESEKVDLFFFLLTSKVYGIKSYLSAHSMMSVLFTTGMVIKE